MEVVKNKAQKIKNLECFMVDSDNLVEGNKRTGHQQWRF